MEEGVREPKISLVEILFVGAAIFVLDFVSEIPILGPLLNFGATQGYLGMKGMAGTYQLAMLGGNALTEILSAFGLGFIPVDLVVFLGIAAVDHFAPSSVATGLEKAGQLVSVGEGVAGAGLKEGEYIGGKVGGKKIIVQTGMSNEELSALTERTGSEGLAARETAGAKGAGAKEGGAAEKRVEPEALGEERELLGGEGRLQKELFEETPSAPEAETPEPESGAKKRLRESFEKVRDIKQKVEDISQYIPQGGGTGSEGDDEEFREAA